MRQIVTFNEYRGKDTYRIDPAHVSLVAGRERYTSLLVQGYWFHVDELEASVLAKLGW